MRAGQPYRIAVVQRFLSRAAGPVPLTIRRPDAPANDDIADARVLRGRSVSMTGTNIDATREPGEPFHGSPGDGATVWYRWTAPRSGIVDIDTCGSDIAALLSVYTAAGRVPAFHTLDRAASVGWESTCWNRDEGEVNGGRLQFPTTTGTTYWIAIDGDTTAWFGIEGIPLRGRFDLTVSLRET